MKKTSNLKLTIGVIFLSISAFGQNFLFDIHDKNISEIRHIENSFGSEKIPNESYYSMSEIQPISFRRKEKNIPDLIVQYDYKKDSTLTEILYEWDVYNFDKKDNNKQSSKLQKALIKKYLLIKNNISSKFGASIEDEGDFTKTELINDKGGLKKSDLWKPNDSTEIIMYTVLSNYYEKKGMVTRNPTHRIRLYIKNTKKEESKIPTLDEKKLDTLNLISQEFIQILSTNNIAKSKEFLSKIIIEQVTDEQMNSLVENIDFKCKIELFYSGVQIGLGGNVFPLLQYKYSDDISNPPKEIIKIIFDYENKIVGIQPITLQGKIKE